MQWTSKSSSPRPKKFCLQKSKFKTMLITFLDKHGVIHKEFVPEGQRVNSAFYVELIGRLLKCISRVRPQFRAEEVGSCCTTMPDTVFFIWFIWHTWCHSFPLATQRKEWFTSSQLTWVSELLGRPHGTPRTSIFSLWDRKMISLTSCSLNFRRGISPNTTCIQCMNSEQLDLRNERRAFSSIPGSPAYAVAVHHPTTQLNITQMG
jgi:hypothetical protein